MSTKKELQDALALIDSASSTANGNREVHKQIEKAIAILKEHIEKAADG